MFRLALLCLVAAACHDETSNPAESRAVPSFRRDIAPVLDKQCTGRGCHGDDPDTSVTLDLRLGRSYLQLVGVPSEMGDPRLFRVMPYDPGSSMLVHKLSGQLGAKAGKRMPIDDETGEPLMPDPIPGTFVDDMLVPWILAGSFDN